MKFVRDSANVGLKTAKFLLVAIWTRKFQIFEIFSALQFNMKCNNNTDSSLESWIPKTEALWVVQHEI